MDIKGEEKGLSQYVYRGVSRKSNSMFPMMDTSLFNYKTKNRIVRKEEPLWLGHYYIYKREKENETEYISHQLVGKYQCDNQTIFFFKGINNAVMDNPVERKDIIEEIEEITIN